MKILPHIFGEAGGGVERGAGGWQSRSSNPELRRRRDEGYAVQSSIVLRNCCFKFTDGTRGGLYGK